MGARPPAARYPPDGAVAAFVGQALPFLGLGLYTRLRPRHFVAVDAEAGIATFVLHGATARQVPMVGIGHLENVVEQRRLKRGKSCFAFTSHVARSRLLAEILLHESADELETRSAIEARDMAWKVPYVKPVGERIVTIDTDYCESSEHEWLHHELRRLVVEVGRQSPLA